MVSAADIAEKIGNDDVLGRKSRVRAFEDLPGVPEGTKGLIALVGGWDRWIRYHVLFENGVTLGSVNRELLAPAKKYEDFKAARQHALESGAFDEPEVVEDADGADGDGAAASSDSPVVNGVTIPAYLIERSKAARERLGG